MPALLGKRGPLGLGKRIRGVDGGLVAAIHIAVYVGIAAHKVHAHHAVVVIGNRAGHKSLYIAVAVRPAVDAHAVHLTAHVEQRGPPIPLAADGRAAGARVGRRHRLRRRP